MKSVNSRVRGRTGRWVTVAALAVSLPLVGAGTAMAQTTGGGTSTGGGATTGGGSVVVTAPGGISVTVTLPSLSGLLPSLSGILPSLPGLPGLGVSTH